MDMIDVNVLTRIGVAGDHVLPDHAAERSSDDVGRSEAQSVEYAYGVIGHVGQR